MYIFAKVKNIFYSIINIISSSADGSNTKEALGTCYLTSFKFLCQLTNFYFLSLNITCFLLIIKIKLPDFIFQIILFSKKGNYSLSYPKIRNIC